MAPRAAGHGPATRSIYVFFLPNGLGRCPFRGLGLSASSLLSGRVLRSAWSGCRPACGSERAEGYLRRVAGGGETPGLRSRLRACPLRGLRRRLGRAGFPLMRTAAASAPRTAARTGRAATTRTTSSRVRRSSPPPTMTWSRSPWANADRTSSTPVPPTNSTSGMSSCRRKSSRRLGTRPRTSTLLVTPAPVMSPTSGTNPA